MTESEQTVSMTVSAWQETMAKALQAEAWEVENARLRQQIGVLLPAVHRAEISPAVLSDTMRQAMRNALAAYRKLEGRDGQEA